jgi:hypothetical protein
VGAGGTSGLVGAGVDESDGAGAVSTGRGLSGVGEVAGAGALGSGVPSDGGVGATLDLGSGKTCVGCAAGSVEDWAMTGKVDCDEKEGRGFCCDDGSAAEVAAAAAAAPLTSKAEALESELEAA